MARPLRVPVLDIPLDHLGPYEVEVGEAGLPDGALSDPLGSTSANERPASRFWIAAWRGLEIEPVDPARPRIGNIYREPFDGVEPVRVFLVFDVTEFSSPSCRSATSSSSRPSRDDLGYIVLRFRTTNSTNCGSAVRRRRSPSPR